MRHNKNGGRMSALGHWRTSRRLGHDARFTPESGRLHRSFVTLAFPQRSTLYFFV